MENEKQESIDFTRGIFAAIKVIDSLRLRDPNASASEAKGAILEMFNEPTRSHAPDNSGLRGMDRYKELEDQSVDNEGRRSMGDNWSADQMRGFMLGCVKGNRSGMLAGLRKAGEIFEASVGVGGDSELFREELREEIKMIDESRVRADDAIRAPQIWLTGGQKRVLNDAVTSTEAEAGDLLLHDKISRSIYNKLMRDAAILRSILDGSDNSGLRKALEAALTMCVCRGTGNRYEPCTLCGDSTYDHYCDDVYVPCTNPPCVTARAALAATEGEKKAPSIGPICNKCGHRHAAPTPTCPYSNWRDPDAAYACGVKDGLEKAAKVADEIKGGYSIDPLTGHLDNDPDGPWIINRDVAAAIRALIAPKKETT